MDQVIKSKTDYINDLLLKDKNKALELCKKDFESPISESIELHPDSEIEIKKDIKDNLNLFALDINSINKEAADLTNKYNDLITSVNDKLNNINNNILDIDNKLQDVNLLCGNLSEFDKAITLTQEDFSGNFSCKDGVFSSYLQEDYPVDCEISEITGNGYEGNTFVLTSNGIMADEIIDAKNHNNLIDDSMLTYYDYSRISSDQYESISNEYINYDDTMCECIIHIKSSNDFNSIKVNTEISDLIISSILFKDSNDSFEESLDDIVLINRASEENIDGIYTNGFIYFPSTTEVKITFKSDYYFTNETISMDISKMEG